MSKEITKRPNQTTVVAKDMSECVVTLVAVDPFEFFNFMNITEKEITWTRTLILYRILFPISEKQEHSCYKER